RCLFWLPRRPTSTLFPYTTLFRSDPAPQDRIGFTSADLDEVLAARGEFLDIEKDDLEEILVAAELRAYQRRFGEVHCADIMSRRSEEHTSELQSRGHLVCRLLLEK